MNKRDFIDALRAKINYSEEDTLIINDILEKHFFISKKNKDKIINELCSTLKIEENAASKIYNEACDIIDKEIKDKIRHPFKNRD